ncbi:MAG: adenylosuccinate lyase [Spirochaetaceae bacterium]|jgi:adenylosuccinate lyase|nr:adenylosuccinate lyase [Spirochaetaceae bacterium]
MLSRSIFQNISPLDHRYSVSESEMFSALSKYLSEEASVNACARAETALVKAHLETRGLLTDALEAELDSSLSGLEVDDVYAEEEKTRHNIRALVNVMKKLVPKETAHLVHLGATSVDILDSAQSWRIRGAVNDVILPALVKLEDRLCGLALREAGTPQVARTHGQHAVPITLGFMFSGFASRLGKSIIEIRARAGGLRGKLSGAAGAYNATSMMYSDPEELERRYLARLGLEASEHSTQLVEPEYLLRLLLEVNTAFGIIAHLADDLRNLQRSEIGELREGFAETQVGSSTMPQKRNPWNSEHVKSLWKAFMPRVTTFFMDQISEHQRDLTNSASSRFIAEYLAGFALAVSRMSSVLETLGVDRTRLCENLAAGSIPGGLLAESAYILLAESGQSDAHEIVRRITLEAETQKISFASALKEEPDTLNAIEAVMRKLNIISEGETAGDFFEHPERYRGLAAKKARRIAEKYRSL